MKPTIQIDYRKLTKLFYEGMTYNEIGKVFKCSGKTIALRVKKLRLKRYDKVVNGGLPPVNENTFQMY